MRRSWSAWLALLWLVLLPGPAGAAEPVPLPALEARVTDLTGTLDANQRGRLESRLAAIDRSGRAQIAVLLLPTTQPETIEAFGIRLAEAWKIGLKGADNGIIVIVAKSDRRMRIEVGYGLEGAIPDAVAKRIIDERMAPRFKQGDFAGGLEAATDSIAGILGGGALPPPQKATSRNTIHPIDQAVRFITTMIVLVVFALVLRVLLGLFGTLLAAAIGGAIGFKLFGTLAGAGVTSVLTFVLSLGISLIPLSLLARGLISMQSGGGGFSGGRGGFPGGGGFSGGGGGGFSGGGGSFGGGGSSGSW